MSRKDCRDKSLAAAVGLPATEASSDADKAAAQSQQDVRRRRDPECVRVQHRVTEFRTVGISREFAVGTIYPHITCQ